MGFSAKKKSFWHHVKIIQNFIEEGEYFNKLINVPFSFSSKGTEIMFKKL